MNERILEVHMQIRGYDVSVVGAYGQIEESSDIVKDGFYGELSCTLGEVIRGTK